MNYREFKQKQEDEANEYTKEKLFFAFGTTKDEVIKALEEQGVNINNIVGIGNGAYVLKDQYEDILKFFDKQAKELKEFTLNNLNEVLIYEFANYEMEINLNYSYTSFLIEVLGFSEDEIKENKTEIKQAIQQYKKEFYEHN